MKQLAIDGSLTIVQLHSFDYGGGAEAVARLNQRGLNAAGHRCHFWVAKKLGHDANIQQIQSSRGVPGLKRVVNAIEARTGLQYLYSPSFHGIAASLPLETDVVHIHSLHGAEGWADLSGCRRLAKQYPVILSVHDGWLMTGHCLHGVECDRWKIGCGKCPDLNRYPAVPKDATHWNWCRKRRLFKDDRFHFIAPSKWVKSQVEQSPILHKASVDVVANPIDTTVFHPGDRASARSRLGIPPNVKVVLIAASHLNVFKGRDIARTILDSLAPQNIMAIIVGRDSEQLTAELKIPSLSIGYIADSTKLADCYRATDVVIVPSRVETFGLVAVEAVACGAAVVSFHAGGLREVMESLMQVSVEDGVSIATRK